MESKYLTFKKYEMNKKKTLIWKVSSKRNDERLGFIKWYAPWRQYCFYPVALTIFNKGCLADIQKFIEIHKYVRK